METTFADLYKAYDVHGWNDKKLDRPLVLDHEGDLWIDVGGGDDGEPASRKWVYRFRVSSESIRHASPVFDALVSGPWQEQKPTAADDKNWVVALPDDYPVAMAAVLAMIYRQGDILVPGYSVLQPECSIFHKRIEVMWRIVLAAEKYDVANLLWEQKIAWSEQTWPRDYIIDSEDDHLSALLQLRIL